MPIPDSISAFIDAQAAGARQRHTTTCVSSSSTGRRSVRPETSHTDGLLAIRRRIFAALGVRCDEVRTVDRTIPPGLWPDMREHGYADDDFPEIYRSLVVPADIMLLAGPIWLGDQSSQTRMIIERLYAYSSEVNEHGQWAYYGKVGGVLTTGNEDGGKHVSAQVLYALQHIGLTIPPAVGQLLDRGGRARSVLPRRGRWWGAKLVDDPQRDLHDMEHVASGTHAQGRRRDPRLRQFHPRLEPRAAGPPKPRVPLTPRRWRDPPACS